MARTSQVKRSTKETEIEVSLDLDGQGESEIDTSIPFWITCFHSCLAMDILTLS